MLWTCLPLLPLSPKLVYYYLIAKLVKALPSRDELESLLCLDLKTSANVIPWGWFKLLTMGWAMQLKLGEMSSELCWSLAPWLRPNVIRLRLRHLLDWEDPFLQEYWLGEI